MVTQVSQLNVPEDEYGHTNQSMDVMDVLRIPHVSVLHIIPLTNHVLHGAVLARAVIAPVTLFSISKYRSRKLHDIDIFF